VLARNQQVWAENIILKRQLREIERIICERKEWKQGKRNVLKRKTVVSTPEVLEELEKCANLKKTKRGSGGRRNQVKAVQEVESSSEEKGEDEEREVLEIIEVAGFRH